MGTSETLLVVASQNEVPLAKRFCTEDERILVTGIGPTNVIKALKDVPKETSILNIGYAGSPNIPIGTEVIVGQVQLYHKTPYEEPIFNIG